MLKLIQLLVEQVNRYIDTSEKKTQIHHHSNESIMLIAQRQIQNI